MNEIHTKIENEHLHRLATQWEWEDSTIIEFNFTSKAFPNYLRAYYNGFEIGYKAGGCGYSKICTLLAKISKDLGVRENDYNCHCERKLTAEIADKLTEYGNKRGLVGQVYGTLFNTKGGYILVLGTKINIANKTPTKVEDKVKMLEQLVRELLPLTDTSAGVDASLHSIYEALGQWQDKNVKIEDIIKGV